MTSRPRFTRAATPLAAALLIACGRAGADVATAGGDDPMPPPAAALSQEGGISLEDRLEDLDAHLTAVLDADLGGDSQADLLAAEAATDRLLEGEPSAEWLASGYLVEARLRQLQALADRIIAELRRGVTRELILEDVAALRQAARDLRTRIAAAGNGPAPTPLDSLLAGVAQQRTARGAPARQAAPTIEAPPEPVVAPDGGPLGQPLNP